MNSLKTAVQISILKLSEPMNTHEDHSLSHFEKNNLSWSQLQTNILGMKDVAIASFRAPLTH